MKVVGINYGMGIVSVMGDNGSCYTCPMQVKDGEPCFKFKGSWHSVVEYASDGLMESGFSGIGPREKYFRNSRDSVSQGEFESIANRVLSNNPDVYEYRFFSMGVRITVYSRARKTKWTTVLDYNDRGQITGRYTYTQAYDGATLPRQLGDRISGLIKTALMW